MENSSLSDFSHLLTIIFWWASVSTNRSGRVMFRRCVRQLKTKFSFDSNWFQRGWKCPIPQKWSWDFMFCETGVFGDEQEPLASQKKGSLENRPSSWSNCQLWVADVLVAQISVVQVFVLSLFVVFPRKASCFKSSQECDSFMCSGTQKIMWKR